MIFVTTGHDRFTYKETNKLTERGGSEMSNFRDALAPLSARMIREHQVLHIAADLPQDDGAIDRARSEILKWAQKRSGGKLPSDAMAGRGFDLLVAGRNSSAVAQESPHFLGDSKKLKFSLSQRQDGESSARGELCARRRSDLISFRNS